MKQDKYMNSIERSIDVSKKSFEKSFNEEQFYNRQTQDDRHLELILDRVNLTDGMKVLDLGTGSGYLAFPIAMSNPSVEVIGLDIVEETLSKNAKKAEMVVANNLKFCSYDGITFPFQDEEFDCIVTRYALHHFPTIKASFSEMNRVLKAGGRLIISDPTHNSNDTSKFVDEFMKMKEDGHIKFYSLQEYIEFAKEENLQFLSNKYTHIEFPRKNAKSYDYLMEKHSKEITDGYHIKVICDEIYITEKVLNMVFEKIWYERKEAEDYIINDLSEYGIEQDELNEFYQRNSNDGFYSKENLFCIAMDCDYRLVDGEESTEGPSMTPYYGFSDGTSYDLANMNTGNYLTVTSVEYIEGNQ